MKLYTREEEFDLLVKGWFGQQPLEFLKKQRWHVGREDMENYHFFEYKESSSYSHMAFIGFTDEALELARFYTL
jgi:hypothetical protein